MTATAPISPSSSAWSGELGLTERVSFERVAGDAVPAILAAADALLFPVQWEEPWGLVPLEAMASGTPVVATGTGGSGRVPGRRRELP